MKKHRPERSCIGCGRKQAKNELIRFVCDNEGLVIPDIQHKFGGRGAYLCSNEKCLQAAIRGNKFSRAFRRKVDDSEVAAKRLDVLGGIDG
ncbi:MAG: YlxR family protein [Deltaproteobacteria bacterium]|nr:YlxR family protein [Deltaproteobacteria bacterium]